MAEGSTIKRRKARERRQRKAAEEAAERARERAAAHRAVVDLLAEMADEEEDPGRAGILHDYARASAQLADALEAAAEDPDALLQELRAGDGTEPAGAAGTEPAEA